MDEKEELQATLEPQLDPMETIKGSAQEMPDVMDAPEVSEEHTEKKPLLLADITEMVNTMLVSIFVVLLLFTYFLRPVTVEGRSMNNTLSDGDRLLMYRFLYEPEQGDIVIISNTMGHVFDDEGNVVDSDYSLDEHLIKRVVAVAGQTIDIDSTNGVIYIDGEVYEEDYIADLTLSNDGAFTYPITIPDGYVFVMGDNRNHSTDSRNICVGLVSVDDVLGKAVFRYYPFDTIGILD